MKLVTYTHHGAAHFGAISGESVIDVALAASILRDRLDGADVPSSLAALVRGGDAVWDAVRRVVALAEQTHTAMLPLADVRIEAPRLEPSKIICVGLNYADHCREQNIPLPESPVLFVKFPSSVIGPDEAITWPQDVTQQVDYEAELAVIIGREARNVPAERAYDVVAGYTMVNDISARDVQFGDKQWVRGKSFDTFCPIGPALVTPDEIADPQKLAVRCRLNGALMQDSSTAEMIFDIPYLIAFITRTCTLLPGDIISTGTPDGVGVFRNPQVFLKPGDTVEVEVEGLGVLRNPIR